jgi:signal peptidase I
MEENKEEHPEHKAARQETGWQKAKRYWAWFWHFMWVEDSAASWIANIIVAFIIIKFIVYPVLGWALGTSYPIVAVVSGSMQHDGTFADWWVHQCKFADGSTATQGRLYEILGISQSTFESYSFHNGFNRGDLMILYSPTNAKVGDVLVYSAPGFSDPIIHRIIVERDGTAGTVFETKGDANCGQNQFEKSIAQSQVLGKAVIRIPLLGWIKIGAVDLLSLVTGR